MSYGSSHFHIVYSTKERVPSIPEELQPKLWAYTAGIAANHGIRALAIGGIEDHVHALISLPAIMSIAEAAQMKPSPRISMISHSTLKSKICHPERSASNLRPCHR